jgi:DNA invertase Pin-like site-specific DNA recombinase
MGRFLLTQMASVAELEAGLISERTKAALAAAKARGVKLGNPNGARALRGKQVGNKQAVATVKANAAHRASNLRAIVDDLRSQGITSIRAIAAELNDRGILTPRGGAWHPTSTGRLLARLQTQPPWPSAARENGPIRRRVCQKSPHSSAFKKLRLNGCGCSELSAAVPSARECKR